MIKQENPKIFSPINPNIVLIDARAGFRGLVMGKVEEVAKQYGVTMQVKDNGCIFSAPKSRLQMFVEKLHFSNIRYKVVN